VKKIENEIQNRNYVVGKYRVFRGTTGRVPRWYVFDTEKNRYSGGSFETKREAKEYVAGKKS
jgi:hypothetical protein